VEHQVRNQIAVMVQEYYFAYPMLSIALLLPLSFLPQIRMQRESHLLRKVQKFAAKLQK
jgi:hypothetical protein